MKSIVAIPIVVSNEAVIKRLEALEASAFQLGRDCRNTIKLIEHADAVSTASQGQQALSSRELAKVTAARRGRMAKRRK